MKNYLLLLMILLISCRNSYERSDNAKTVSDAQIINVDSNKDIDSLRNEGFEVYSEYNFFKFSGKILSKNHKVDYPLLAVKKEGETLKLVSILFEGICVSRLIDKNGVETVKQLAASEEIVQSNFIIRYEKNRIVVFNIREFYRRQTKSGNFYLDSVYYIYDNSLVKYSQSNNNKRMLKSINDVDISTEEKDLKKLFTSDSEVIIEIFKEKNFRKKIYPPLASYLMMK